MRKINIDEREDADDGKGDLVRLRLEQRLREEGERHEQDVPSEHVGHESDGQRERADEDHRNELDDADKRLERRRHARRPEQVSEVAEALVLDADADEDHPHEQRQAQRDGDAGGGRHLQNRDDPRRVAQVDEDEQADRNGVQGSPALPIVGRTTCDSMNSTIISARLRIPLGALVPSRLPARKKIRQPIRAATTAIRATLLKVGKKSFHRRMALIGGNSRANTTAFRP